MALPFTFHQLVHGIPDGPDTPLIEEVAHIDTEAVDELAGEICIFHQAAEETGSIPGDGEVGTEMQI